MNASPPMPVMLRFGDVEHGRHGDGGVDRVAAALQDVEANLRRERLARGDHGPDRAHDRAAGGTPENHWSALGGAD